ncbi:hemin uptake protein HemP [Edwardsiella hoshinae]|uniref:Hemin uptake protein n=1 Tax=Edwardsiella hoshinae TaxID=93378 RepID=A0A376DGC4_9GAMM|nr:hemin uptake protein HemP [Edwardsiella hoshinae]QPR27151.1 hemin uptake protein HemP [Edwardsiella hoshinae]STC88340.1 Hemin uptake protein [Edwardsiella hoshinae]
MEKVNPDAVRSKATPVSLPTPGAVIASHLLLGQDGRVIISHQGEHYQLRQTRSGKLILTK